MPKSIEDIAKSRVGELASSNETVFRFMTADEFKDSLKHDSFSGEANYTDKAFSSFLGKDTRGWDFLITGYTDWYWSSEAPRNYKEIENALIQLLNKYRKAKSNDPKRDALIEFRMWLLDYIVSEVLFLWQRRGMVKKKKIDMEKLREEIADLQRTGYGRYWFERGIGDHINSLIDDPEYLVKNEGKIRDIIQLFAGLSIHSPGDKGFFGSSPYEVMVFFRKKAIKDISPKINRWTYIVCKSSDVLACLIVLPNRKLCQDITSLVTNTANIDPKSSIPLFNSRGILFWP